MRAVGRHVLVGCLLGLSFCGVSFAQADMDDGALLDLLSFVPQTAAALESGWATVRFVDYEALFQAEGASVLRALGSVDLLMSAVPLGGMMTRIVAGPEALTYLFASAGRMQDVVGFEWLLDVDRSLEFGDPPDLGLFLQGGYDVSKVGAALESRGFALTNIEGIPVWHRLEDFEVSLANRDPVDPFGGNLGAAARIAALPDALANARAWPTIESIVACATSGGPSLADDPAYAALARAVATGEGVLIQALFFSGPSLRAGAAEAGDSEVLPEFSLAVLADRQEGTDQVHLIALYCADEATAQTAAGVLARRLEAFRGLGDASETLVEKVGATIDFSWHGIEETGAAIALVEARYVLPSERTDPETGTFRVAGLLYRAWVRAILGREFTPLW